MISTSGYLPVLLDVDDLVWTRHWLRDKRCDAILILIASGPQVLPRVNVVAIESKASQEDFASPDPAHAPFSTGVSQVLATLESIVGALGVTDDLVESLRASVFMETVATATAGALGSDVASVEATGAIATLQDWSLGRLGDNDVAFAGLVVTTFYRENREREQSTVTIPGAARDWRVTLVSASAADLATAVHGAQPGPVPTREPAMEPPSRDDESPLDSPGPPKAAEEVDTGGHQRTADDPSSAATDADERISEVLPNPAVDIEGHDAETQPAMSGAPDIVAEEALRLADALYAACQVRGIPLRPAEPSALVVGSSLVAIPMPLSAGHDIRPIRAATEDLEREVGIAPITVENDPARAGHVRFLLARPGRVFPGLPTDEDLPPFLLSSDAEYGALVVGETLEGAPLVSCLSTWPHMLVGGGTMSGKTTLLKTLLWQASRWGADYCRIALADGKQGVDFFGLVPPECFVAEFPDVLMGTDRIAELLAWLSEEEIPRRSEMIRQLAQAEGVASDAKTRLLRAASGGESPPFPALFIVVDEFAEIMAAGGPEAQAFEANVRSVAQVGRAALVHLVLATQRPDATIVKGAIKANLDARIALSLPSQYDSKTILDGSGAERLLGRGDMIFKTNSGTWRLQGYQLALPPRD